MIVTCLEVWVSAQEWHINVELVGKKDQNRLSHWLLPMTAKPNLKLYMKYLPD